MFYFFLGVITGVLLTGFLVIMAMLFKQPIIRTLNQTESKLRPKGKIFEPENQELQDWVNSLKKEENGTLS